MNGKVSLVTATLFVVANMVGTGLFTTLGFLLVYPFHGFEIGILWLVGGMIAVFGSFCYGRLAGYIPRSGGEVQFLSEIYGRPFGFSAGVISVIAGFSAPIAAATMSLVGYISQVYNYHNELGQRMIAVGCLFLLIVFHHRPTDAIEKLQNLVVILKIAVISGLVSLGLHHIFTLNAPSLSVASELMPHFINWTLWVSPAFGLSFLYVAQAYSGWNAAVYIADEIEDSPRHLPRALLFGTLLVVFLSVSLNLVFYLSVARHVLEGQKEVAFFAARAWLGPHGGECVAVCIAFGLLSAVSSMVWAGSRVITTFAQQLSRPVQWLYSENSHGRPGAALWFLFILSSLLIVSSSFAFILELMGFSLTLCSALSVFGLFILKRRYPNVQLQFRDPFYPWSAIIYVVFCTCILALGAIASPWSFFSSISLFVVGWAGAILLDRPAKPGIEDEPLIAMEKQL